MRPFFPPLRPPASRRKHLPPFLRQRPPQRRKLRLQAKPPAPVTAAPGSPFANGLDAYKDGDIAKATSEMEKAVAEEPANAEASAWLGFLYVKQNDGERAIPILEKAISLKPTLADPYTNLGNALLSKPNPHRRRNQPRYRFVPKSHRTCPDLPGRFF